MFLLPVHRPALTTVNLLSETSLCPVTAVVIGLVNGHLPLCSPDIQLHQELVRANLPMLVKMPSCHEVGSSEHRKTDIKTDHQTSLGPGRLSKVSGTN